jgi:hypothetical protein
MAALHRAHYANSQSLSPGKFAARYDHGPGKEDTGPRSGPIGSSGGLLRAPRHVDLLASSVTIDTI